MISTKPRCGGSMDLPLDAHKSGLLFMVGSDPLMALPTQGSVVKSAKCKGEEHATNKINHTVLYAHHNIERIAIYVVNVHVFKERNRSCFCWVSISDITVNK
jgi:hypothetical protein